MILSCGFSRAVYTWKLAGEPDRGCTFTAEVEIGHANNLTPIWWKENYPSRTLVRNESTYLLKIVYEPSCVPYESFGIDYHINGVMQVCQTEIS
jgi:hypothetical protein